MTELEFCNFLKDLMDRRHCSPTRLAAELGASHPTIGRWLSGENIPSTRSCRNLAEYSGVPLEKVLSMVGHVPHLNKTVPSEWPEFREYAQRKYPKELDEDLVHAIEGLIERRRVKRQQ